MSRTRRPAFTIVELLVVVSIMALLIAILLPAVNHARSQAKVTASESNLRQLGTAHANYASEWNDRQFSLTPDDIASYAIEGEKPEERHPCITGPTGAQAAVEGYECVKSEYFPDGGLRKRGEIPPVELGWGAEPGGENILRMLRITSAFPKNYVLLEPIVFSGAWQDESIDIDRGGYFRMPNARQFTQYLSGRFYDDIFYAPKDVAANDMKNEASSLPNEFTPLGVMRDEFGWGDNDFCYSSYSLSPAGLFAPEVLQNPDAGGWQDPWSLNAGFRAPSFSQARYSGLKTHMLEHHWLQNGPAVPCNPAVTEPRLRPYRDCQPYFFNHAWESSPVALFYDSHVELIGVRNTERADGRHETQAGYGLWSRDTPFDDDGYFIERGYDQAATSFHIFTTDGILGRDMIAD